MAKDELGAEEFLSKLDELKQKLPYDQYRELERQLPYGIVEHAQAIRRKKRKKLLLLWLFVYGPILILLIIFVPQLLIIWLIPFALQLVALVIQQVWESMKPPRLY